MFSGRAEVFVGSFPAISCPKALLIEEGLAMLQAWPDFLSLCNTPKSL